MNDFERQVLSDLAELKTQMRAILGNGHAGRLQCLEQQVAQHERNLQRAGGMGALLAALVTLVHVGIDWLRIR